jgi:hypothetical protein
VVEITEIGPAKAPGHRAGSQGQVPEVARRALEESEPVREVQAKQPSEHPTGGTAPTASAPGAYAIHILVARGGRVDETHSDDLADVVRAVEQAENHEVWVDIGAEDAAKALAPFGARVSTEQYLVQNQEKRSVLAFPYLVREEVEPRYCIAVAAGDNALVTVHPPDTAHDPVSDARRLIDSAVHAKTDSGFKPLGSFREFVFLQIAESCVTEVLGCIQKQSKRLGQVYDHVHSEQFNAAAIQTTLLDIHRYLEQTLAPTLFLLREFFFTLERGGARYLSLDGVKEDLVMLTEELDRLMALKSNMDTTIELISNAVRAKLSEQTLEASWQLQLALEVLVRVSLLLMIPTAVFSLWPLMPFPVNQPFELFGITTYSVVWNVLTALVLTVVAQLMLSRMYKRAFGLEDLRRTSSKVGAKPKA